MIIHLCGLPNWGLPGRHHRLPWKKVIPQAAKHPASIPLWIVPRLNFFYKLGITEISLNWMVPRRDYYTIPVLAQVSRHWLLAASPLTSWRRPRKRHRNLDRNTFDHRLCHHPSGVHMCFACGPHFMYSRIVCHGTWKRIIIYIIWFR